MRKDRSGGGDTPAEAGLALWQERCPRVVQLPMSKAPALRRAHFVRHCAMHETASVERAASASHDDPVPAGRAERVLASAPIHVVLNPRSGRSREDDPRATIESALRAASRHVEFHCIDRDRSIERVAAEAARSAHADGGIVVVAGGDGTISTVARELAPIRVPMGVVPAGTFNLLAREYRIPEEPRTALEVILAGRCREVQAGSVNDRLFFVNASIGWYPQLLADREAEKRRLGRTRAVAVWAAIKSLMREYRALVIDADIDGASKRIRTPTLFVGNNRLQLARVGFDQATEITGGSLLALTSEPIGPFAALRLLLMGALGQLDHATEVDPMLFHSLTVQGVGRERSSDMGTKRRHRMTVAMDGESCRLSLPLRFAPHPVPLRLIVPDARDGHDADENARN